MALFHTTDAKAWTFNYSSGSNYFYVSENAATRLVIANGGNVGIGTSAPAAPLDVAGNSKFNGSVTVSGNKVSFEMRPVATNCVITPVRPALLQFCRPLEPP